MHVWGLSSQRWALCLGQEPLSYPLMGNVWGNVGPNPSAQGSAGARGRRGVDTEAGREPWVLSAARGSARSPRRGSCSQQIDANPVVSAAVTARPWQAEDHGLGGSEGVQV